jgi:hypothetical protein
MIRSARNYIETRPDVAPPSILEALDTDSPAIVDHCKVVQDAAANRSCAYILIADELEPACIAYTLEGAPAAYCPRCAVIGTDAPAHLVAYRLEPRRGDYGRADGVYARCARCGDVLPGQPADADADAPPTMPAPRFIIEAADTGRMLRDVEMIDHGRRLSALQQIGSYVAPWMHAYIIAPYFEAYEHGCMALTVVSDDHAYMASYCLGCAMDYAVDTPGSGFYPVIARGKCCNCSSHLD